MFWKWKLSDKFLVKQQKPSFIPEKCIDTKFIGTNCNMSSNPCNMSNLCQNGGTCHNHNQNYTCECRYGFKGTHCNEDHRLCQLYTCSNHGIYTFFTSLRSLVQYYWFLGICNETSNTTFNCTCHDGWEGIRCQLKIDHCKINLCLNRGVCRSLALNYTCECLHGYFGDHCENLETTIILRQTVSKSFAYIAIVALVCVAIFVLTMDILKYCFGIDPSEKEREKIRQEKLNKKQTYKKKKCDSRKPKVQIKHNVVYPQSTNRAKLSRWSIQVPESHFSPFVKAW